MGKRNAAVAAIILVTSPACALNDDDLAAMMGMLWRLRQPICPRMAFDPNTFVKTLRLSGGNVEAARRSHRHAFDRATPSPANGSPTGLLNSARPLSGCLTASTTFTAT
jgi:hypothetical protein